MDGFRFSPAAAAALAALVLFTGCSLHPVGVTPPATPFSGWSVPPTGFGAGGGAPQAREPDPEDWPRPSEPVQLPAAEFQALVPFLEGEASWYGPSFHGKKTANGETYNQFGFTAAHRVLPMNTLVRVRNLKNRRTVLVRINDRGPYKKGRILDLSRTAAQRLGMIGHGTAPVHITVVRWPPEADLSMGLKPYRQFVVQVAAYPDQEEAHSQLANLARRFQKLPLLVDPTPAGPFAVVAGPFDEEYDARRVAHDLKRSGVASLVRSYRK